MAPEMVVEMRADQRSDLFSLGAVMFEMLTGDRLFQGDTTTEVLEHVVTADIPEVARYNPVGAAGGAGHPGPGSRAQPARRFPSAGAMGEACEHFLYDKGYGPTNLSLKHYLASLFGGSLENEAQEGAQEGDPVLIPLDDEMRTVPVDPAGPTRVVSPLYREPPVPSAAARRAAATVVVRPVRAPKPKPKPRER